MKKVLTYSTKDLKFYDGLKTPIDRDRYNVFENKSVLDRFFSRNIVAVSLFETFGYGLADFTNVHPLYFQFPDIKDTLRIFTLWAEDRKTNEVVVLLRGFYILEPFIVKDQTLLDDFSRLGESFQPFALVSSIRTIIQDSDQLGRLIEWVKTEIEQHWKKRRQIVIETLDPDNPVWKRFVFSFDKILYYSFVCPSIDREFTSAFRKLNFHLTSIFQQFSSPTADYDQAIIKPYLRDVKAILVKYSKEEK